mgnify:CR=1 FL=1
MGDDFDFGFTAVDENELDSVQKAQEEVNKAEELYAAIMPLLENLKKNPDKDYILWPDRVTKIESFKDKLDSIMKK